jgi:3-dehydroquinate synthase
VVGLPYRVTIEGGALDRLPHIVHEVTPGNKVVVWTDANVGALYMKRVVALLANIGTVKTLNGAGEQLKTREWWSRMTDDLLAGGYGRDTTIVALGGGVIGDLAGFVAATYMRGIPVIQVPTSLLAMVDASVGGKTGIDTPFGKNLVGAFHQPAAVVIDPLVLQTLPREHLRAGFAEIVKHGVIADAEYFDNASTFAEHWPLTSHQVVPQLTDLIRRSVEIKAAIVIRDEREAGLRKVLNFGHTIAHAIEVASSYTTLHGEAVAMGLVAEARLAERLGVATAGTSRVIERVCRAAGLPTTLPAISIESLVDFTHADKKARAGRVEYALPKRIGEMAGSERGWTVPVEDSVVRESLAS